MLTLLFFVVTSCWLLLYPSGAPLNLGKMPNGNTPSVETLNFMKRFGYLDDDDGNSEALYSEEGISEAIKLVQRFGAIPESGKLDNATLSLMASPRCGVPDITKNKRQKRFIIRDRGWNKRRITYFIANWSPKLGEYAVIKNIQLALDAWGRYARLTFHRVSDPSADIIVAFGRGHHGDNYPFDGPGNILAHAFFPYEENYGGDIHFDDDEIWTNREPGDPEDGTDFFTVAVHELGHSLGLGHSAVSSSIMFPYYRGFDSTSKFLLDYDDILGMYELYIRRFIEGDQYPTEVFEENVTTTTQTTTTYYSTTYTKKFSTDYYDISTQSSIPTTTIGNVSYWGDDEDVDVHKEHDDKHGIPSTNSPSLPNICDGSFDATATLRQELFIFKDQYIWRLKEKFKIEDGYPVRLHQMFPLPTTIKKIDAAYERPDGMIVLFTGDTFWIYDGSSFVEGSPRPISQYGLPKYLDSIDAVQIWAKNGKTYLYKNDRFWRYNETSKQMDPGYPRHMEKWRGVPVNIDAATTWKDSRTYFFKDKLFWKFDNDWVMVTDSSPLPAPQTWLGCPEEEEYMLRHFNKR